MKWVDAVRAASKKLSKSKPNPVKKKVAKKVGAVRTVSKKHTDAYSHNVKIKVMSGVDNIELTRVNNDNNGNPRYVVHFLNLLNDEEKSFLPFNKKYEYALKKAKLIGGKKFDNKQYGGGIVFQSYNTDTLKKNIAELRNKTPKIKY